MQSTSTFPDESNSVATRDVESLLAQELNQMSFEERELLYEEIHGVDPAVNETPEMIAEHLSALEIEIQLIPNKPAYDEAVRRSPDYIKGRKFRLMFLRADQFKVRAAAHRLVLFLENQRDLFGQETLGRPLRYNDLDNDTKRTLQTGVFQWLPARDRTGRAVLANLQQIIPQPCYKKPVDMVKMYTYLVMSLLEDDEEFQKKGFICIFYFIGDKQLEFDFELHSRMPRTMDWMPTRVAGVHFCSSAKLNVFLRQLLATMTKQLRVRMRFHGGTHTECQYSLLTFGIPTQTLPVNYEGEVKNQHHWKWVNKLKIRDEARRSGENFEGIDLPRMGDVLLGRGRTFQDHTGSVNLRRLVDEHMADYCAANKNGKTKVTWDVVKAIQQSGGRFLKRNKDGWWVPVSDDDARTKVGMSFRTALSTKGRSATQSSSDDQPRFMELENRKRFRVGGEFNGSKPCFGICST